MDYPESFHAHRLRDGARVARWSQRILAHAPTGDGGLAVDVGCGVGRFTGALQDRFPRVVGIDRNPDMLALAARRARASVDWLAADATALPLAGGVARFVLASMVLEHVRDKAAFFAEVRRVLAPGGVLALRTMLPDDIEATGWYAASARARTIEHARTPSPEVLLSFAAQVGLECRATVRVSEVVGVDALLAPLPERLRERGYEALHQLDGVELAHAVAAGERLTATPGWTETLASSLLFFSSPS